MDLPITPKFFKKLELFQGLRRLDTRNKDHEEWKMEKEFLFWAHENHFHLGTYFNTPRIIEILSRSNKFTNQQLSNHTLKMMQNTVEHGWAEYFMTQPKYNDIKINRLGILMAEVIFDSNSKLKRCFYIIFSVATWIIFGLTILALVLGVIHLIILII